MTLTDTFASTAAVTIPVLMLAGAVELRSLADAVTKHTAGWGKRTIIRMWEMVEAYFELYKQERQATILSKILSYIKFLWLSIDIGPLAPGAPFSLSLVWLIAIMLSGVSETFCFLYLAGVHVPSEATLLLSIVAIVLLMILLIMTPAARTLISAPLIGFEQLVKSFHSKTEIPNTNRTILMLFSQYTKDDPEVKEAFLGAMSALVDAAELDAAQAKIVLDRLKEPEVMEAIWGKLASGDIKVSDVEQVKEMITDLVQKMRPANRNSDDRR